jgi:Uma2 family endonuclease
MPSTELPRRKLTTADVAAMVELGSLQPDERVELLDGDLILVTPQGPVHSDLTETIADLLRAAYPKLRVREHSPLALGPHDEPEPDVAVVRGRPNFVTHPTPTDVVLVVEVAYSALEEAVSKVARYAAAGIPLYILVDAKERAVTVYENPVPSGARYSTAVTIRMANTTIDLPETSARLSLDFLAQIPVTPVTR